LRILFLNNFYYLRGGSERVLFDEIAMLKKAGHETAVFSRTDSQNEASLYQQAFPPDMRTDGLRISLDALRTVREVVYSTDARERLKQVIDEFRPDIAHAHNIYGRLSTSVFDALEESAVPVVQTLHDYKLLCPSYLMLNHGQVCERCVSGGYRHAVLARCHKNSYLTSGVYAFESWFGRRFRKYGPVSCFLSPSRFLKDKILESGVVDNAVVHVPNSIDTGRIRPGLEPGGYFLYFGRLSHEKGVGTLLAAFNSIERGPALVITGDGPKRGELEELATGGRNRVSFTGYLSGEALEKTVREAFCVIVPSECYENAPLAVLEAFAHGKPVIGARIGGIPEMIDDGVNGLLFQPGIARDLEEKMRTLSSFSSGRIREMGNAAVEKVRREYSAEMHYQRLLAVYDSAARSGQTCA
jgi:glycosyltransferase involved in cell wall biosynthesis